MTSSIVSADVYGGRDYQCGIGSCRPRWLQALANKNVFVLCFACMELMQSVFYYYFRSVITTLEKQFAVQSQTIGFILTGKELSQILCGLILAYYGGQGNRPRWIACGMLIVCLACVVMVSPIFLYLGQSEVSHALSNSRVELCTSPWLNSTLGNITTNDEVQVRACDPDVHVDSVAPLLMLFVGGFIAGTGFTMLITLTFPYLDDNVTKSASALYIAFVTGMQVTGPTIGSMLGGVCLRFYVTLSGNPGITPDDPKWIGAWWLGFMIIGIAFGAGALIVVFFPRQLKPSAGSQSSLNIRSQSAQDITNNNKQEAPKIRGLATVLKRLLKNKILMCHALARCFILFGTNGFDTFQPKYMESHFWQTASGASFFSGISGNAMRIVGILVIGLVYRFWKPKAIYVNAWNLILDLIYIGSLVALMLLSCPTVGIVGLKQDAVHHTAIEGTTPVCNSTCSCDHVKFNPVCLNNKNYFSACHAGCQSYTGIRRRDRAFYNCSCGMDEEERYDTSIWLMNNTTFSNDQLNKTYYDEMATPTVAKAGYCPFACSSFTAYLIILGIQKTLMATRKVGRMLIILRCIDSRDKSLALALHTLMESVLAYIPCPIIYGALLDAACIMWGNNCGKRGNCWFYDADYLRYVMHGVTLIVIAIGTVLDGYVLYLCRSLNLFDDPDEKDTESGSQSEISFKGSKEVLSDESNIKVVSIKQVEY
ncbi:hypothetical protein CHUAL_002080 [Chamberlinius hualienensis]